MSPGARAMAAAVGLGAVALLPAWQAGFVHDDTTQILANPWLRDFAHLPTLWTTSVWSGLGGDSSWYRPLQMTSFALERAAFGFTATAFHAVTLALFFGVVALAGRLALAWGGGPLAAGVAAGAVALHPANVEAAVWISARGDLLSAFGALGALLAHERARTAAAPRAWRGWAAGALAFGLFGKENAAAVWPVLFVADLVRRASFTPGALLARHAGFALVLALYLVLRTNAIGSVEGGLGGGVDAGAWLAALGQGVSRWLWPVRLSMAPPAPEAVHAVLGAVALVVGAAGLALGLRRRAAWAVPWSLAGVQLAVAALAATRTGELADRYLLLPTVGLGVCVALALERTPSSARRPVVCAIGALALALGVASFGRARVFRDDGALWRDAWRKNPASVRAAVNLGAHALVEGRPADTLRWMDRADALSPGDPDVALNRATALADLGRPAEARALLEALAREHPSDPGAHLRLGHLALDAGDAAAAEAHYRTTLEARPLEAEAWAGLGVALAQRGRGPAAREALQRALELDPAVQNAAALRTLLARLGG